MLEHPVNLAYNCHNSHEQAASYGQSAGRLYRRPNDYPVRE
jgi:hypothetical protein